MPQNYTPEERINRMWADAIQVQDACNLSGVVHAFSRILADLCKTTQSTKERNTHPVCIMFASKVASLTGCEDLEAFGKAYEECKRQAELTRQTDPEA